MPLNYFIYNPKAGNHTDKNKSELLLLIKSDPTNILFETTKINDEIILTDNAIQLGAKNIIAVGGDGTFNKVASRIAGKEIDIGLIPVGSGNGLARHLGISLIPKIALHTALRGKPTKIEVFTINHKMFFCTAGIGFDAEVASVFNKRKKRGILNYIISFFIALIRFKPIEVEINGMKDFIFLCTFANANQYGNNAFISPVSNVQDGTFEIIKIRNYNVLLLIPLLLKLFLFNLHKSKKVETSSAKSFQLKIQPNQPIHIDGESMVLNENIINIGILPHALSIRL